MNEYDDTGVHNKINTQIPNLALSVSYSVSDTTVLYARECRWPAQRGYSPSKLATTVGGKHRASHKEETLLLNDLFFHWSHFVGNFVYQMSQATSWTAPTTRNSTEHNCITLHAQNATLLQLNVLLNGKHRLPVTSKGQSDFPCVSQRQGQLQTPH